MTNPDNKIKWWAKQCKPRDVNNRETTSRILRNLRPLSQLKEEQGLGFNIHIRFRPAFVLTLLALFILAAGIFLFLHSPGVKPVNLLLNHAELAELRVMADELNRVFPEGIQWVSKIGNQMDIRAGDPHCLGNASESQRILLSFHLVEKKNGQMLSVKRYDIIIWNEEPVEIKGQQKNVIWVHKTNDNHVFVSLDMCFRDSMFELRVQDRFLLALGTRQKIVEERFQEKTYEIHQSVYSL